MPRRRTRTKRSRASARKTRRRIRNQRGGFANDINEWTETASSKRKELLEKDYSISQLTSYELKFKEASEASSESMSESTEANYGLSLPNQAPSDIRRIMVRVKELLTDPGTQQQYDREGLSNFLLSHGNVDLTKSQTQSQVEGQQNQDPSQALEYADIQFLNDVERAIRELYQQNSIEDFTLLARDIKSQFPLYIELLAANANPEDEKSEIPFPVRLTTQPVLPG
jgi:hypothetical protein